MKIIEEIEARKLEHMSRNARRFPSIADATLRLIGYLLGEYDKEGWKEQAGYEALTNAHLLRILHSMGLRLSDRWNYSTSKRGGNLLHVYRYLLSEFHGYSDDLSASGWGDDYWDDCYITLALLEGRRQDPGYDATLNNDFEPKLDETLEWMARQASADFTNAGDKEWSGPGFHAAALELFHVATLEDLYPNPRNVISAIAANLQKSLAASRGKTERWDPLFAWHIGQVVATWSRLSKTKMYASLDPLKPLIDDYYDQLISSSRRTRGDGWSNGGTLIDKKYIMYGTARALAAAYARDPGLSSSVISDAHAFIIEQMDAKPMLQGLKACVNTLESLQMIMKCRLPGPDLYLMLDVGARLTITGLYDAVLSGPTGSVSAATRKDTLKAVRTAARDALERSGSSAVQPLGVNGELLRFASENSAVLDEFGGKHDAVKKELEAFLSATMTEVRAKAARSLLRRLWTRPGLLHYAPFFERLADLEHMQSFFADYRDHVNHQILVFLLGAYMYYEDSRLKEMILEEIRSSNADYVVNLPATDQEFLFRWKLASTFHDVGYIFEVSPTDADPSRKRALVDESVQFIQRWMSEFLVGYFNRDKKDRTVAEATVKQIDPDMAKYARPVAGVDDLFTLVSADGNGFATMARFLPAHLGTGLLESYFKMCRNNDAKGRERFYDHGIMSAAVLLKTADIQHHYLLELRKLADSGKLKAVPAAAAVLLDPTTEEHLATARFWVRFAHAAGAIALHNIYPTLFDEPTCAAHGLREAFGSAPGDPRRFLISTATPLAYLMALADGLQDWDRHSFRLPSLSDAANKTPLSAHEILLTYDRGKLYAVGLTKTARDQYARRFAEMKLTLNDLDEFAVQAREIR